MLARNPGGLTVKELSAKLGRCKADDENLRAVLRTLARAGRVRALKEAAGRGVRFRWVVA